MLSFIGVHHKRLSRELIDALPDGRGGGALVLLARLVSLLLGGLLVLLKLRCRLHDVNSNLLIEGKSHLLLRLRSR